MNLADWVLAHAKKSSSEKNRVAHEAGDGVALTVVSVKSGLGACGGSGADSGDDTSILGRFGDLGLASGETIQYFGRAPLGEPVYICVRETVIALRLTEAALIAVTETAGK